MEAKHEKLIRLLNAASLQCFKIWMLSLPLKISAALLVLAGLAGLLWASWKWASVPVLTLGTIEPSHLNQQQFLLLILS